ncbi:AAA family ATPase [Acidimicrobiia bacterium EGI L10123]|uniref:AAA family ATPase n=1 Tax=Salinilacustrithrix flava TaxID=2957203 RepID=UPI003D7C2783|nr:AAA family ATPase [Acidimicrobiia bacterium EGI L10123]
MDLLDYLRLFRRRWALIVACVLVAGLAAWFTTPAEPANDDVTYSATHTILRDSSAVAPQALATVALYVKTGPVPERAAERLDWDREPALLASDITLEPNEQVGTLDITATGTSPEAAAERANVFAEETLSRLGEQATETSQESVQRVNEQLTRLQAEIDDLNDRILEQSVDGEAPGVLSAERDSKLRQYGAALDQQQQVLNQPPPSAGYVTLQAALPELAEVEGGGFSAPDSREGRTLLAAIIGLLFGLAAVLVLERLDTRLHDVDEIGEAFGLPVIAEVPSAGRASKGELLARTDNMSGFAESYRTLRAALLLSPVTVMGLKGSAPEDREGEPEVVLVTSAAPGDGKTTTVANLAVTMAETGRSVLVLGCDFRRPEIHGYFDVPTSPGVADVLTGRASLASVIRPTDVPGVSIAPSGDHLRSLGDVAAAGRKLIEGARGLADVVIIDTPPLLATNDASELIPAVDAVVVVSRVGKTTSDGARRTRFLLDRLGAPVAGIIAIGVPERDGSYASYYRTTTIDEAPTSGRRRRRQTRNAETEVERVEGPVASPSDRGQPADDLTEDDAPALWSEYDQPRPDPLR